MATYTVTNTFTADTTAVASEVNQNFTDVLTALNSFDAANLTGTIAVARISDLTTTQFATNVVDTDDALAADSDTRLVSQSAVKTYIDTRAPAAGVIKAWVNFDGDDGSINSSYNVTSVSRSAAGTYTITWDTNFSGTNEYAIAGFTGDAGAVGVVSTSANDPLAAGTATIKTVNSSGSNTDFNTVTVIAIGTQ